MESTPKTVGQCSSGLMGPRRRKTLKVVAVPR
jgi:hypothetical protein